MGYCYDSQGHLCCDVCGGTPARRYKCPFGWCQAIAMCKSCKSAHPEYTSKAHHRERGCERQSENYHALKQAEQDLIDAGKFVRRSALGVHLEGKYVVHALFEGKTGHIGKYMSKETYDAISFDDIGTPEDYAKFGEVRDAPADFDFSKA